jgi:5-formyltetrahydrofolate cyclo-ligase
MTKNDQKNKLRKELLKLRSSIPEWEYLKKSVQICDQLKELEVFTKASAIHCYVSMNKRREVNTHPLIKQMLANSKKVVVPITQMETGTLTQVRLHSFNDLEENAWGVLEPVGGEQVEIDALELVIVPMAGGDRQKNRIGYGKGFYDRFLDDVECPTIGLTFEECMIEEIPTEPFDVPLDTVITEKQLY